MDPLEFIKDLRKKENIINVMAGMLKCKPEDVSNAIDETLEYNAQLQKKIDDLVDQLRS